MQGTEILHGGCMYHRKVSNGHGDGLKYEDDIKNKDDLKEKANLETEDDQKNEDSVISGLSYIQLLLSLFSWVISIR